MYIHTYILYEVMSLFWWFSSLTSLRHQFGDERAFNEFQFLTERTSYLPLVYEIYVLSSESEVWASVSLFCSAALSVVLLNTYTARCFDGSVFILDTAFVMFP